MFNSEIYYFLCILQEYYISHSNVGYAINCIYNYCVGQVSPTDFFLIFWYFTKNKLKRLVISLSLTEVHCVSLGFIKENLVI